MISRTSPGHPDGRTASRCFLDLQKGRPYSVTWFRLALILAYDIVFTGARVMACRIQINRNTTTQEHLLSLPLNLRLDFQPSDSPVH